MAADGGGWRCSGKRRWMSFSKRGQRAMQSPGTQRLGQRDKLMPQYPGVQKRQDGRFRVRVKARAPKTGRVKELKKVLDVATHAEAAKAKQELREQFEAGSSARNRERLADYARSWLRGKLPKLKPATRCRYAQVLEDHVLPDFGDHYVDKIERDDVIAWLDAQRGEPSTVNGRFRVLRTVMADATIDLDLARNPCARLAARSEPHREGDHNRLTAEELDRVLAALHDLEPERYPLFLTLALTGARVGEVTALKWGDVDFDASTIHIQRARWKKHVGPTKTGRTRRVPMPDMLATALKGHRKALMERQVDGFKLGWIFPSKSGSPVYASTLQKPLKRALTAAGITERFTIHGFRRTFNNLVRPFVTGDVLRSIMGHATERMTEHYSHIQMEEKRKALNHFMRLVPSSSDRSGLEGGTSVTEPNEKTS